LSPKLPPSKLEFAPGKFFSLAHNLQVRAL
jgi:hypothetical protein